MRVVTLPVHLFILPVFIGDFTYYLLQMMNVFFWLFHVCCCVCVYLPYLVVIHSLYSFDICSNCFSLDFSLNNSIPFIDNSAVLLVVKVSFCDLWFCEISHKFTKNYIRYITAERENVLFFIHFFSVEGITRKHISIPSIDSVKTEQNDSCSQNRGPNR